MHAQVWRLDLSDLESVHAFAQRFLDSGRPLHVLLANAGIMSWEKVVTKDGHELTHQSNHLGHFLLAKLLLPRLQASAPARVVQVRGLLVIQTRARVCPHDIPNTLTQTRKLTRWHRRRTTWGKSTWTTWTWRRATAAG